MTCELDGEVRGAKVRTYLSPAALSCTFQAASQQSIPDELSPQDIPWVRPTCPFAEHKEIAVAYGTNAGGASVSCLRIRVAKSPNVAKLHVCNACTRMQRRQKFHINICTIQYHCCRCNCCFVIVAVVVLIVDCTQTHTHTHNKTLKLHANLRWGIVYIGVESTVARGHLNGCTSALHTATCE